VSTISRVLGDEKKETRRGIKAAAAGGGGALVADGFEVGLSERI
jgi:hypothetical protein